MSAASENIYRFRRCEVRIPAPPDLIRGYLVLLGESERKPFQVWDLSNTGLGLMASEPVAEGVSVMVTISQPKQLLIPCRVAWCQPQANSDLYRLGLKALDPIETGILSLISSLESEY